MAGLDWIGLDWIGLSDTRTGEINNGKIHHPDSILYATNQTITLTQTNIEILASNSESMSKMGLGDISYVVFG